MDMGSQCAIIPFITTLQRAHICLYLIILKRRKRKLLPVVKTENDGALKKTTPSSRQDIIIYLIKYRMALLSQSGETGKRKEAVSDQLQTANGHIPHCIHTSSYIFKTTSWAVLPFGMVFLWWTFFCRRYVCIDSSLSKQFK